MITTFSPFAADICVGFYILLSLSLCTSRNLHDIPVVRGAFHRKNVRADLPSSDVLSPPRSSYFLLHHGVVLMARAGLRLCASATHVFNPLSV